MWLFLFYPFLCLSRSYEETFAFLKLRYSILYISQETFQWEEIQKKIDNITKNSEAFCNESFDGPSYNLCKDTIDAFQSLHFSNPYQIDKILKTIPRNSEVLYAFNTANDIDLNFNYLVNKKKVVISDPNYQIDNETAKYSLPSKTMTFLQSILFNKNTVKKQQANDEMNTVNIIGNIKYTVSYLVINHHKVSVKNFNLELDTLVLINSALVTDGIFMYQIQSTNLLVNSMTHLSIIKDIKKIKEQKTIKVHQYGLFYDDSDQEFSKYSKSDDSDDTDVIYIDYRIVFQKDCWQLFEKWNDEENYTMKEHFYFPYEFCDIFNLVAHSLKFDLNVNDTTVETVKDVNITVVNLYDYVTPYILLDDSSSEEVSITSSGFWSKLKTKPKIIVCLEDSTKISPSTDVEIEQHKLYSYSPAPPLPDPTSLPPPEGPKYPRTSYIFAFTNLSDCNEYKEEFNRMTMNYTDYCKEQSFVDFDDCCNYCQSIGEYICSNGYDINSKLPKISVHTDQLVILDTVEDMSVDFRNLKDKMNVVVAGINDMDDDDDDYRIHKIVSNVIKKSKKVIKDDDDDDDSDWNVSHISIQGNITDKVSSLELMFLNVSFTNHEVNVDSLIFHDSCFNQVTEPVRSNYFVASLRSHYSIIMKSHRLDLIKVKQYSIALYEEDTSFDPSVYDFLPMNLRISFENDRWKLLVMKDGEDDYSDFDYGYLPYSYADQLNIIIKSLNFDFHIENTLIKNAKPVNLTIKNYNPYESLNKLLSTDDELKLAITTSGSWDSFDKKPEIIVGLPNSIDYSAPQSMTIKREELYSYRPKTPPENPINPFVYPVTSYLCISSTKSKCTKFQTEYEQEKENCRKLCKTEAYYSTYEGGYEECIAFYETLGDSYISDGNNIDQTLSIISNATDNLIVMYDVNDLTLNFKRLIDQMTVIITPMDDDDKYNDLLSLRKEKKIKSKKIKDDDDYLKLNLVGDISSKVSYLSIIYSKLNIIENDLNINTLYLQSVTLDDSSKKIRTTNLIVDIDTQDFIVKNIDKINQNELIKVNQYGFAPDDYGDDLYSFNFDDEYIKKDFQISFSNDLWRLLSKKAGEKGDYEPYSSDGKEFGFVPYSFSESFNLIAKSLNFDFFVKDSAITTIKPVNVSILKLQIVELSGKFFYHKDVKITSSGNWAAITNKTKVIFTVDENEVSIQNEAKNVEVLKEKVFEYVPKSQRINDGDDGGDSSPSDEYTSYSSASDEFTSSSDDGGDDSDGGKKKLSKKMMIIIISGCVGGIALIVLIIVLVWYYTSYKKRNNFNSSTVQSSNQLNQFLLNN